ncbi:hypothetical protein A3F49_03085 [Candidatus Nomurabacteria bacterium RIFCSPHIGHO2_12_FULL_42_19]|nr:MAG: hypothetical protein A3F49_03085 [Candidatus Nomurabacteria bacterium RIFCSPHIGHO2_12_FULL_42_19]
MEQKGNLVVLLVVVLALVAYAFWTFDDNFTSTLNENSRTANNFAWDTNTNGNTNTGSVNANTPAAVSSYAEALSRYRNARIQLNENCRASPSSISYKNNSSIMIDNRAGVARRIRVGSIFDIPAYGFKIVQLSSAELPATWYVDCDTYQNVATILIQK